ncbi:MAG: hypothetical protein GY724_01920, partial [Actinomycetia bacterium]|nr:hypothetical protein [Actinomycetes bacterium]
MVGRTTVAFGLVAALVAGGGSASAQTEHPFEATDVGAGGWLHSGAFHPTDPDVILVGTDRTGG